MINTSGPTTITEFAPAKINLYLHVTGKRADGYHLLDSLMVFAGVGDTLRAEPAEDLSLAIDGPMAEGLSAEPDNLVLRAARGLQDLTGTRKGAVLTLTKNLPVSSGIGGGSADAAATLRALARLWGVAPDQTALADLALSLGADVPVCLKSQAAFASGVGETLDFVESMAKLWMVLVNPGVAVSTPAVFKARAAGFTDAQPFDPKGMSGSDFADALSQRRNDLYRPALELQPKIGEAMDILDHLDAALLARMSGSGATCYALFDEEQAAISALKQVQAARPRWWSTAAPMLVSAADYKGATTGVA